MPQETIHIMTTYEMIATAIAILALLQPWIIKLWDRFFRKIHVNFIPTAKIKLYYNRSGAYSDNFELSIEIDFHLMN